MVPPKITSANSSQRIDFLDVKTFVLLFTDRISYSHTRATPREPVIILESRICSFAMNYECHRNTEEDFNFRGLFSLQGKSSSEEKIKVFGKSTVAIQSLILRSTEVDLSVYVY